MQGNKWKIVVLSSYLRRSFIIMIMTLLLNFEKDNFQFTQQIASPDKPVNGR